MEVPVYKLEKPDFSGPLDLLLRLIEKNKVDIMDIPIAEITRQYMEQVEAMEEEDMEIVSDFLVMAAELLDIKARMLLMEDEAPDEDEQDPREVLAARLLEYKRIRYTAGELRKSEDAAAAQYYRSASLPEELSGYVPQTDLDELLKGVTAERLRRLYLSIMSRMKRSVNDAAESFSTIRRDRVSVAVCIQRLRAFAGKHSTFTFRQMTGGDMLKAEIVVSFLAVLELMKLGKITARQPGQSADIIVSVRSPEDLDSVDLVSILDE